MALVEYNDRSGTSLEDSSRFRSVRAYCFFLSRMGFVQHSHPPPALADLHRMFFLLTVSRFFLATEEDNAEEKTCLAIAGIRTLVLT